MPVTRAQAHAERTLTRLLADGALHRPADVRAAAARMGVPADDLEAAIVHLQIGMHVRRDGDGYTTYWWMPDPAAPPPHRAPTTTGRTP